MANAIVQLAIDGPSSASLTSQASDGNGMAEASWTTSAPNKRGMGGTPSGNYSVSVGNVTATGYRWDGQTLSSSFSLQSK